MTTTPVVRPEAETVPSKPTAKKSRVDDRFAAARNAKKKAKRLRHRKTIRRSNSRG